MPDEKDKKLSDLRKKVEDICEKVIEQCHSRVVSRSGSERGVIGLGDLKNLMFVIREAWYLADNRFAELSPEEIERRQEMEMEGLDEDVEDSDETDPFGGK